MSVPTVGNFVESKKCDTRCRCKGVGSIMILVIARLLRKSTYCRRRYNLVSTMVDRSISYSILRAAAFIGSNSSLIAPLSVGAGATELKCL